MADALVASRLAAAHNGDSQAFSDLVEPYRYELRVHCYRMLGSLQDAEDLVQETFLRAWRRLDSFKENTFFRAWLYKIATNACLDALDKQRPRRILVEQQFPLADSEAPSPPINEPIWLEPLPDEWLSDVTISPEAHYASRENVTLAFLAALQHLPPRQRAVLILREVFDWNAREVAEQLDLTVSAVNSLLHRARTTMNQQYHADKLSIDVLTADTNTRALLDRYIHAWESGDVETLIALLKEDTVLTMPPFPAWYRGREAISRLLHISGLFTVGQGRYRMLRTQANNQIAVASYWREENSSEFQANTLHLLQFDESKLTHLTVYFNPSLFAHFGLPEKLTSDRK